MTPRELVPRFLYNREEVFNDPQALQALSDFGRNSDATHEALEWGVKQLGRQFHGRNLLIVATPDTAGHLQVDHASSTLPLNGNDAKLLQDKNIELRGIMSRSYINNRDELIPDRLHEDEDYLEFSKEARAVYAVPIRRDGKVLGVFCIDTSDASNFRDENIKPIMHNFIELFMLSLINNREEKIDLIRLERDRLKTQYANALAGGWPLSPALLEILSSHPSSLNDLEQLFPRRDVQGALLPLSAARLVEYRKRHYSLTTEGERLASTLRRLSSHSLSPETEVPS